MFEAEANKELKLKAIIHIGGEKTGTTTIQAFLSQNREKLISHGFLYPVCFGLTNQVNLSAYCLADEKVDDIRLELGLRDRAKLNKFRADLRETIQKEIGAHPGVTTVLMSNEHLQSRLITLAEVQRLKDFVGSFADDIKIIVYLRRQDRVAVSYFSTKLRAGLLDQHEIFPILGQDDDLPPYYDFNSLLRLYEEVFGIENISLRIFESARLQDQDLIADFSLNCGFSPDWRFPKPTSRNTSLSKIAIMFFQRFNELVPRFVDDRPNPLKDTVNRDMTKRYHGAGPRVPRTEAEAFYSKFVDSNREISRRYFHDPDAPLFDSDFSSYDDDLEESISTQEFIDLAVYLWTERTSEILNLRFEKSLLEFSIKIKEGAAREALILPNVALWDQLPPPMLFKYMGGALYINDPWRVIEASTRITDGEMRERQVFIAVLGLAYLRAGKDKLFNDLMQKYAANKRYWNSLSAMHEANLGSRERSQWIEFLKNGDAMQRETYVKCLAWIDR